MGERLSAGGSIFSPNGAFQLRFSADGALFLRALGESQTGRDIYWSVPKQADAGTLGVTEDGAIAIFSAKDSTRAVWTSDKARGTAPFALHCNDNGTISIADASGVDKLALPPFPPPNSQQLVAAYQARVTGTITACVIFSALARALACPRADELAQNCDDRVPRLQAAGVGVQEVATGPVEETMCAVADAVMARSGVRWVRLGKGDAALPPNAFFCGSAGSVAQAVYVARTAAPTFSPAAVLDSVRTSDVAAAHSLGRPLAVRGVRGVSAVSAASAHDVKRADPPLDVLCADNPAVLRWVPIPLDAPLDLSAGPYVPCGATESGDVAYVGRVVRQSSHAGLLDVWVGRVAADGSGRYVPVGEGPGGVFESVGGGDVLSLGAAPVVRSTVAARPPRA